METWEICEEMKYSTDSCNAVRSISREIVKKCEKLNSCVDESAATLATTLLSLDPSNGLRLDGYFDRKSIDTFVTKCVDFFTSAQFTVSAQTIKMQAFSMKHTIDSNRIAKYHKEKLEEKTVNLTKEIISNPIKTVEERDRLFKKIVIDIIVQNSLGNPTNVKLIQETASALKSVTSKNDISSFASLKTAERLESLIELREIVCGIHIFNKDSGIWSGEIIDVEKIVISGYNTTKSQLNISLNEISHRTTLLMAILNQCIQVNETAESIQFSIPEKFEYEGLYHHFKDVLIMNIQHEKFIKSLSESLSTIKTEIDDSLNLYQQLLAQIHDAVKYRTAIPSDQVFPRFSALAKCWHSLQNQVYMLSEINIVNEQLIQLSDQVSDWEDIALLAVDDSAGPQNTEPIPVLNEKIQIIEADEQTKIENANFCTWAIAKCNGLLIQPKNSIGLCAYNSKNYSFCCREAAIAFQSNPEKFKFNIIEVCRANPELINLLDAFDEAKAYRTQFHRVENVQTDVKHTNDVDCQTELHPIPKRIDRNYYWNIWDLRRMAIQYANLRKCRTTSAQTNTMYHRFAVDTQTWLPKENGCQTNFDAWTNVPKPDAYLRFARGKRTGINANKNGLTDYVNNTRYIKDHSGSKCVINTKPIKDYTTTRYIPPHIEK